MTIAEVLNKANEGGYHIHGSDGMDTYYVGANSEYSVWTRTDNEPRSSCRWKERCLIPHFGKP